MKAYTLKQTLRLGIELQGGQGGVVPYLAIGLDHMYPGVVIPVAKEALSSRNSRLLTECSVNKLTNGHIEITAANDPDDKRLLVLTYSSVCIVHHSARDAEVLVEYSGHIGETYRLIMVEPGKTIPMRVNNGSGRYSNYQSFEFRNNDGVPEIVPGYTQPPKQEKKESTQSAQQPNKSAETQGMYVLGLIAIGVFLGFLIAGAMHFTLPMVPN